MSTEPELPDPFDLLMTDAQKIFKAGFIAIVIGWFVWLALFIGVIYVAWHFISKIW
jgi:hypothetical protein